MICLRCKHDVPEPGSGKSWCAWCNNWALVGARPSNFEPPAEKITSQTAPPKMFQDYESESTKSRSRLLLIVSGCVIGAVLLIAILYYSSIRIFSSPPLPPGFEIAGTKWILDGSIPESQNNILSFAADGTVDNRGISQGRWAIEDNVLKIHFWSGGGVRMKNLRTGQITTTKGSDEVVEYYMKNGKLVENCADRATFWIFSSCYTFTKLSGPAPAK
jgi:hypothetical protein